MKPGLIFIFAAAASWCLGWPLARWLGRFGFVDKPNSRSSHRDPTARGGGAAMLAAILIGAAIFQLPQYSLVAAALLLLMSLLGIVSIVDDIRSLHPLVRFSAHAAAAVAVLVILRFDSIHIGFAAELSWQLPMILTLVILFLWIAGYTNAFNFMDGINGIAAGQAVITGLGTGLIGGLASKQWDTAPVMLSFLVAGAAAGFLPRNFPRAQMFMGDVGSAPLGFLLAVLLVWLTGFYGWELFIPLALLHANFVLDTAFTLLRRIVRGERWYEAHREHFYQRLVQAGESHTFVTSIEMALQLVVVPLTVVYLRVGLVGRIAVASIVFLIWGLFFVYCETRFRQAQHRKTMASLRPTSLVPPNVLSHSRNGAD